MPINKAQILALPTEEKIALAEEIWSSLEENVRPITEDEIAFAQERLRMHAANPQEGVRLENLKKYFSDKYGL